MYFAVGWPKFLDLQVETCAQHVLCNRDRSLFAVISAESLSVWFVRPCVETTSYKRSKESLENYGMNFTAEWRPDSSVIAVATSGGAIMFYYVEVDDSVKGLYEQFDSKIAGLRRESAELFIREKIPPVSLVLGKKLLLSGNIQSMVCIRDELMAASDDGHIWRIQWDGVIVEDFSLHISRIPFCVDHQQTKGVYLSTKDLYVSGLEYSPLIGGFSIVLSNGRAAFLTATTLRFNPSKVIGIFAHDISDATCTAINHRYRLIAYGLKSAEAVVVSFDDLTGALQVTHRLMLSPKDFPDATSAAGAVTNLKWSPDGGVLAMTWEKGGIAVWSVFGALIMCSLGWDYGVADVMKHMTKVNSMEWGPEGYNLWIISEKQQPKSETSSNHETNFAILQFAKSALTVNSATAGQECIFLQAEDRLYMSAGSHIQSSAVFSADQSDQTDSENNFLDSTELDQMIVGSKQWIIVPIPYSYLGNNWPVRYAAVDSVNENMVIAGRSGLAHYSLIQKRWKLFGSETQEKDFVVMGGLLWYEDQIILGCFNLRNLRDEIRIYCRENKLDNQYSQTVEMTAQVLQLSSLKDRLLCFCADSHLSIFQLEHKASNSGSTVFAVCFQELDVSNIVFHPACVISALLTSVCTETGHCHSRGDENILLNVCGRLLLLQKEPTYEPLDNANNNNNQVTYSYGAPTVLASSVENVWVCCYRSKDTPHLTEALWIACGARGMRVWLPLYPCDGEKHRAHNFMSKRIMLPVDLCIYPLAILFEDAVIVGAENEAALFSTSSCKKQPFCMITRTSQVYLHHILRQLLKRNLGYHAWEIAQSCATLPYFPHSLELLLHEVLEEEATSSEPIPDALLPRVIDFIQEFPVFLQTVVQCTRKTELALWPYLFSAVGNPKTLFQACLLKGELETAASYVIILQNLELPSVSQQYATTLLDNALEAGKFQLANDLVRFLKAIGDNELPPRSIGILGKCGFPQITPPVTPTEEDLSFVLGTVSLTRGRSHSTAVSSKLSQIPSELSRITHHEIGRTVSDSHVPRQRRISEPTVKSVAEKSFVEARIVSHAQKLLKDGKLKDLGNLAAHMDFELIAFFIKERNEAAHVTDFVKALRGLHHDFKWPYPSMTTKLSLDFTQKILDVELLSCDHPVVSCEVDHVSKQQQRLLRISSNNSFSDMGKTNKVNQSISSLDTPSVDCHLVPKAFGEENNLLDASETGSLWTEESHTTCDDDFWTNQLFPQFDQTDEQHVAVSRHLIQTEVKLRYLLHLLLEAGCFEWGVVISVLLLDITSVIQIFDFAKRPGENEGTLCRLQEGLHTIRKWAETECSAYVGVMYAMHNQVMAAKVADSPLPSLSSSQRVPQIAFPELSPDPRYKSVINEETTAQDKKTVVDSSSSENTSSRTKFTENPEQMSSSSECIIS